VKYVQPWGISDPDAPYINGDPSIARQGSIPPAAAFEHPMRELVGVITKSKFVPDSNDLLQVSKGVRSQQMNYCIDTGSVNTLSVALDPPIGAYTFGLPLRVRVSNTNTGASTIDAGAGRVPIRKPNGSEVQAGDLPAFGLAELVYDGTVFQMINFTGQAPSGPPQTFLYNIPYCVDSSTQRNLVIANFSPALTSLSAGTIFMVKIANTNDGSTNGIANINVNALGNKPIFAQGCNTNWPLLPGDIQVGDVLVFTYDGTRFWVYANTTINEANTLNCSTIAQVRDLFSALGRKRISTSGSLRILLATGIYSGLETTSTAILTTYHPDSDRITVEGTMLPGQSPPANAGYFQRTGSSAAARANDSAYNIQMLRARYGTEFQMPASPAYAITHTGAGAINIKNILVTGPNYTFQGQAGFGALTNMYLSGCSVWGSADVGYAAYNTANMQCFNCHACSCGTRGFAATGGAAMGLIGGSSEGNGTCGAESSHGARIGSNASDQITLSLGFQAACNGSFGVSCQSGFALMTLSTIIVNGSIDCYAFNGGTIAQYKGSVGTVSPYWGNEGNLNSIAIDYGP
jgi:hypothetical protein